MTIEEPLYAQLGRTAETLELYGFKFWAEKLRAIQQSGSEKSQCNIATEISKLYGGFGNFVFKEAVVLGIGSDAFAVFIIQRKNGVEAIVVGLIHSIVDSIIEQ